MATKTTVKNSLKKGQVSTHRKTKVHKLQREIEVCKRIGEALFEPITPEELTREALETAVRELEAEAGCILLARFEFKELAFYHAIGDHAPAVGTAFPWDKGLAGSVFQTGKCVLANDAKKDLRHMSSIDSTTGFSTRDLLAIPLKRGNGGCLGVLEIMNKRHGTFTKDDLNLLSIISASVATALEREQLYKDAKLAEMGKLIGFISHDIRNLFMPASTCIGLLKEELSHYAQSSATEPMTGDVNFYDQCTDLIEMAEVAMSRSHDRLKEVSDCINGIIRPANFQDCSLACCVEEVFGTLLWSAKQKNITLTAQGLDRLPIIQADSRRLFNAFYNLINNAIPEVPSGGSISIIGTLNEQLKQVEISIIDTGKGMPEEVRKNLFTPRAQSRKAGGTGLGTKIILDSIEQHGGTITVESEEGKGSTFHVCLPIDPAHVFDIQHK